MSASERICLIGWGAIGLRVAQLLQQRRSHVNIAAVAVRDSAKQRVDLPPGVRLISDPTELTGTEVGLVVEAAGRASVLPWGRAALAQGMDFAVSSTSAFVRNEVLEELTAIAKAHGAQILLPPGALGGIDALSAASRLALGSVEHRIIKPALAWKGTIAEELCDLENVEQPFEFFTGSAREAADAFPQNANATIITSLAGIGPDDTRVVMIADPRVSLNSHQIVAEGAFGRMEIKLENQPLATNPKSSEMTALNMVRLIENRSAALSF